MFFRSRGAAPLAICLLSMALAGCTAISGLDPAPLAATPQGLLGAERYGAITDEKFPVPPVSLDDLKPRNMRQLVDYRTNQPPGTIVVDPAHHFLYLVQEGGKALRYGVGVGREGMAWSGTANVAYKREWPRRTPTQDMIARDPKTYKKWASGMDGGESNPLGARALYLFEGGKDSLYRIHGTNEPWSIGESMSSGCVRMMNQDVIDLFRRVPAGTKVAVLPAGGST